MSFKIIEVIAPSEALPALTEAAKASGCDDIRTLAGRREGWQTIRIIAGEIDRQALLDSLQTVLARHDGWQIVQLSPDLVLPKPEEEAAGGQRHDEEAEHKAAQATREELYISAEAGTRLSGNFILLTSLSTLVAGIGLLRDNVAAVIGAMVIAPLLGPHLAFALASALGDRDLMASALRASAAGVGLTLALALALGLVFPANLASHELVARTDVGYDSVALALASGAAAALSLTSGLSSTLVGVMVSVALMPPAVTFALMLAGGHVDLAVGALLLLAVNVVCVNLSAQAVFIYEGIKPRSWLEQKSARQSFAVTSGTWLVLLLVLSAAIAFRLH